jgi:Tol biopolymer transport system component
MTFTRFVLGSLRACLLIWISTLITLLGGWIVECPAAGAEPAEAARDPVKDPGVAEDVQSEELREELKHVPYKIVYESYYDNHWGLKMVNADGSHPTIFTRTPHANELYPHVSPDGRKICFLVDEGEGKTKSRNVYYSNMDGTDRRLVVKNGRDPCWNFDGTAIVYLKGEVEELTYLDYASKGVFTYDLATRQHHQHPNQDLSHLYCFCCSPDGKWLLATVHAGMGFSHAILLIEANGESVYNLEIPGCRPDISGDGKKIAWGASDNELRVGDLDFSTGKPKVVNAHNILTSRNPIHIYHIDWSPDGKYVAYSRGPSKHSMHLAPEMIGVEAKGWNICVGDPSGVNRWVAITSDGNGNKEPDWVPLAEKTP